MSYRLRSFFPPFQLTKIDAMIIMCFTELVNISLVIRQVFSTPRYSVVLPGIESGNKNVRDAVIKGQFGQDAITKAVKMTHDAGIHIIGNFMFGLPEDTLETMRETLDMAKALNLEYVNFYTTMAYPGSQLYEDAVKQGLELPETWIGYSQFSEETLPLLTKYISSAEVLRFRDNAFQEYYSDPYYLRMIEEKFSPETVDHIKQMLTHKLYRKFV